MDKNEIRVCQNCKGEFSIEPEDFFFYEKIKVPPPTWCPECRMKRRMVFRNERKIFKRESSLTGEELITIYPKESGFPVYNDRDWWSQDKWDPLSFGMEVDFSRPFLAQVYELSLKVPRYHRAAINMVNSDYSANADNLKNCYLMFNSNQTEDSAYGNGVDYCKSCYDNSHLQRCERCYESFWLTNCYGTYFSSLCDNCVSVWFSKNCRDCQSCFGCVNLRSKKYCIFNVQYTKEKYEEELRKMKLDTYDGIMTVKKKANDFWLNFPNKYLQGVQNTNVSGEYITHSKNVKSSYLIRESKDLKYVQYSQLPPGSNDSMDVSLTGYGAELMYESSVCGWGASNFKFCWESWDGGHDFEYSMHCGRNAAYLFGCVGILKQQYCILNRQYAKEEYFALRERIIEHMNKMPYVDKKGRIYKYGEFFPPEFSPFAYNHTIIAEHFPDNKEEAEKLGIRWEDPNTKEYKITLLSADIPNSINQTGDDLLKEIIQCSECKRAYRVINSELIFLRQAGIPIPRSCVDCRHSSRIAQRNKTKIYLRRCDCAGRNSGNKKYKNTADHFHGDKICPTEFETSYSPDRTEIVYCEKCYQKEVY